MLSETLHIEPLAQWPWLATALAVAFAGMHILVSWVGRLSATASRRLGSLGAGISVAYVVVRLLPELAERQHQFQESLPAWAGWLQHHVYLLAVVGLVTTYGLEMLAMRRKCPVCEGGPVREECLADVFWIHLAAYSLYNALIGYLLGELQGKQLSEALLFFVAMGLHFAVTDRGLRRHHPRRYDHKARWILAAAVLVGWLVGMLTHIEATVVAGVLALLTGGMLVNVFKEELPEQRETCYRSFLLGAIGYALLLGLMSEV